MMRPLVLLLLAAAVLPGQAATEVKYCMPSDASSSSLNKCTEVMGRANTDNITFSCVAGGSVSGCIAKVGAGEADLVTLDGGHMYVASNTHGLVPVVSENYGGEMGTEYYGVAVVKKDFCEEGVTLDSLKGKYACHTGYQRTVGWYMPAGELLSNKVMDVVRDDAGVEDVAESIAAFFGKVCAPQTGNGAELTSNGTRSNFDGLCGGCKSTCDAKDEYYGYAGAMHCLNEAGDVAFVKHSTPMDYAADGDKKEDWSELAQDDMQLLCPAGGCADLDEYKDCNFGKVPSHALVSSAAMASSETGALVKEALVNAGKDAEWLEDAKDLGGMDGVIFSGDTESLDAVEGGALASFMDQSALDNYAAVNNASRPARFCVTNEAELQHCLTVTEALRTFDAGHSADNLEWGCVLMSDVPACLAALGNGDAEMRVVDGAQMYEAGLEYDVTPLVAELYEGAEVDGKEYWSVAVVNKEFCDAEEVTLDDLKGKNACHTGYRRSAGWWMPLGALSAEGVITAAPTVNTNVAPDALAMDAFFNKMCAVGVSSQGGPAYASNGTSTAYDKMCTACHSNCSSTDLYAGYEGAFRGLVEGSCDVAFTKHSIPTSYTNGEAEWATKSQDDLRLLCRNGGCKMIDEYKECSLAEIPAHAVVARPDLIYMEDLRSILVDASKDEATKEKMFEAADLWGEETEGLMAIEGDVKEYLGDTHDVYSALYSAQWTGVPAAYRPEGEALYCIPYPANVTVEEKCSDALRAANNENVTFACVRGDSIEGCMQMIANKTADMTTMDSGDQFVSYQQYGLVALAAENYGDDSGASYWGVAVVHKDMCKDEITLKDLKGKNSCHTGYGKTTGWNAPVGYMISKNILSSVDEDGSVLPDAEAVAAFFGDTCAPRTGTLGPKLERTENGDITSVLWEEGLCTSCAGDCTTEDPYYDYTGSLQCLMDNKGDVAFVKHSTPLDAEEEDQEHLRLLCFSKPGCASLEDYDTCGIKVPAHAIMGREELINGAAIKALVAAAEDEEFVASITEVAGLKNVVVKKTTQKLDLVSDFEEFFGQEYMESITALHRFNQPTMRFCVHSEEELTFCNEHMPSLNNGQDYANFTCTLPEGKSCPQAIADGEADLVVLDSHDTYNANKAQGLEVVAAEDYGSGTMEYYAVAVVTKDFCEGGKKTFNDLQGLTACSTSYRKTAGWTVPIGYMLSTEAMPYVSVQDDVQDDAESATAFFSKTCAVRTVDNGPKMSDDGEGALYEPMCTACKDDCSATDTYTGYDGALRCMMEAESQAVAFVKHTTAIDYASDGESKQEWSTLAKDDLRLLCPDGGCAAVDDYEGCNINAVPAHAVLMAGGSPYAHAVKKALEEAAGIEEFSSTVLNTEANPDDFIFKSSTKEIKAVDRTTAGYLGAITSAFEGIDMLDEGADTAGR